MMRSAFLSACLPIIGTGPAGVGTDKESIVAPAAQQATPADWKVIDAVQRAFYIIPGSPDSRAATLTLRHRLEERIPEFRAFALAGERRGLLRDDAFHSLEENEVRLRDWIDDLANGRPVPSIYCAECARSAGP